MERAASSPAQFSGTWGGQLAQTGFANFITSLGPMGGAASQLFKRAVNMTFGNNASVNFPHWVATANDMPWVQAGVGAPIPVRQGSLSNLNLAIFKFAAIMAF